MAAVDAPTTVTDLLRAPRYEVLPLDGIEESVLEHVPQDVTLTVTVSPSRGLEHSLDHVEAFVGHGYGVVPHLSARLVRDGGHLSELVARLDGLGVRDVFVIAGDAPHPVGPYEGAAPLLAVLAEHGSPFTEVGIGGYPESHPLIDDETTIRAMFAKAPYATYIVSQICFDPRVTAAWVEEVWRRGTRLPVWVGIPGAVPRTKLLRISAKIGLGESARFLRTHGSWTTRLLRPNGFSPDPLLRGLEPLLGGDERRVGGVHVFTFNDVADTERWRQRKLG
jgi:methylenetetrahydrofolate reductase (NADPH)